MADGVQYPTDVNIEEVTSDTEQIPEAEMAPASTYTPTEPEAVVP